MASSNVVIAGTTYPSVPAVTLVKSGGGTATFTDVSDTTAAPNDVAATKSFYMSDGTKVSGSVNDCRSGGYTASIGDVSLDGTNMDIDLTDGSNNPYGVIATTAKVPYNVAALGIGLIDNPNDTTSAKIASGNTILGITGTGGGGGVTPPPTPENAVIFYSLKPFTLRTYNGTKNWNGTLQYSTDNSSWSTWDGTTILTAAQSDGWYKLYFRGSSNTYLTTGTSSYQQSRWLIAGAGVTCAGNLNKLLNYSGSVTLATYAFAGLFQNTGIDFDVSLPSTSLPDHCYYNMFTANAVMTKAPTLAAPTSVGQYSYAYMFNGCSSLESVTLNIPLTNNYSHYSMFYNCFSLSDVNISITANSAPQSCFYSMFDNCHLLTTPPALPATTISASCYQSMFNNCKSLEKIPALPAITLATSCYRSMFNGCSKIKVSQSSSSGYSNAYRIPTSGSGTTATGAMTSMFSGTGGTFTGTATVNTTYYTSNTVIS